mmetsp:Transcript_110/g.557  ORF Transcript_110/g.557 Transcript_110/m.557 type:complete len:236 (+) Transcript_110:538-1245(+)
MQGATSSSAMPMASGKMVKPPGQLHGSGHGGKPSSSKKAAGSGPRQANGLTPRPPATDAAPKAPAAPSSEVKLGKASGNTEPGCKATSSKTGIMCRDPKFLDGIGHVCPQHRSRVSPGCRKHHFDAKLAVLLHPPRRPSSPPPPPRPLPPEPPQHKSKLATSSQHNGSPGFSSLTICKVSGPKQPPMRPLRNLEPPREGQRSVADHDLDCVVEGPRVPPPLALQVVQLRQANAIE